METFIEPKVVAAICVQCTTESTITVEYEDYYRYVLGPRNERPLVQECFPYLSPSLRELFFQTGICGSCWDVLFASEEEDFRKEVDLGSI